MYYIKEADKLSKIAEWFHMVKLENDTITLPITETSLEEKTAYKLAMGDYKSDEIISNYIHTSQMNAMLSETALVIAGSMLTAGSKVVMNLGNKAVTKLGAKAGSQVLKAGMTAAMASAPAVETVVGGLTSREGMTVEKGEQAWEELKNGLIILFS